MILKCDKVFLNNNEKLEISSTVKILLPGMTLNINVLLWAMSRGPKKWTFWLRQGDNV